MTINVVVRSVSSGGKVVKAFKGNLVSIEVGDNTLYIIIEPKSTDPKSHERYKTPLTKENYKRRMSKGL